MNIKRGQIYYNERMNALFLLNDCEFQFVGRSFDYGYDIHWTLEFTNEMLDLRLTIQMVLNDNDLKFHGFIYIGEL
jgi:hypothetical protein